MDTKDKVASPATPIVLKEARQYTGVMDCIVCIKGIGKGGPWNVVTIDKEVRNNPVLFNVLVNQGAKLIDLTGRV